MKRFFSLVLALVTVFTLGYGTASAATRASVTIMSKSAGLSKGSSAGELKISYNVTANGEADKIGASSIAIYNAATGKCVVTIYGTTSNGMLASGVTHRGVYSYKGTSGMVYYAEVTVTAEIDGVSDSKTITTATVAAP